MLDLTIEEAADEMGVSARTIYRWIKTGYLPAHKLGGGWRIKQADIDNILKGDKQND